MLFYFIFFKERLRALGVSYLKVGLKAPTFFFPLFGSSVFAFSYRQIVRLAQFDLKVTDRLPQFFSPILNRKQRSIVFFFLIIHYIPWSKAKNELDFFFFLIISLLEKLSDLYGANSGPSGSSWQFSLNSQEDGREPILCAGPLFQQREDLLPWGCELSNQSPKGAISQPPGERGELIPFKQTLAK